MSLIHRHRQPTTETPEQTLARLRDAVSTGGPVPDQHLDQRFAVARKNGMGYNIAEVDAFIDTIGQRTADEIRNVIFATQGRRNRGYDEDEVDRFLDEQIAKVDTATSTSEPTDPTPRTPADLTPATTPEARGRLGRIPQRRWAHICVAFWAGLALWFLLGAVLVGNFLSEADGEDATVIMFLVPLAATMVFWGIGAARTGQMDPSEWTDGQRSLKYIWDHMPGD